MANLSVLLRSLKKMLSHIQSHCYKANRATDTAVTRLVVLQTPLHPYRKQFQMDVRYIVRSFWENR